MKFYIASRRAQTEKVKQIYSLLKERGHEITTNWTNTIHIGDYSENKEESKKISIKDLKGVKDSDIFVLISDKAGTGIYVELGAAILSNIEKGRPKIYIIGGHLDVTVFHFHPSINKKQNIDEVLADCTKSINRNLT